MAGRPAKIRAGIIAAVLQFVAGAGGNAARVRAAAGLRAGDLLDPERLLDLDRLSATHAAAADELDDPYFGLHLGANFDLEALGPFTYAVLNAASVEIGVNNLVRYLGGLVHGMHAKLIRRGGNAALRVTVSGVQRASVVHLQEGSLLMIVRILRRLAGDASWRPLAVGLAHDPPGDVTEHAMLFGVAPTFGTRWNEIRFEASLLRREAPDADRSLLPIVEQRLQEVLGADPADEPWLAALRLQIAGRLCDGHPGLPDIAPEVGLSMRTLQRRLADRGLAYRDLVQQARRRLALEYLEQSDTELTEIAFLLGYAELSAFAHAFQRWTGTSPGAHRRAAGSAGRSQRAEGPGSGRRSESHHGARVGAATLRGWGR